VIGARARSPNPALKPLDFLVGDWRTTGTHPALPGETLHGRTAFAWHEGGAFLVMRTEVDQPLFPDGLAIIASDDTAGRFILTYYDERGTSRIFDLSVGERSVTWRRDHPAFAQSVTITADAAGDRLASRGLMSRNGGDWEEDLSQVFTREARRPAARDRAAPGAGTGTLRA
jgi:hypothetical protein